MWEMYDRRHSSELCLIVDGIEEAVSELISGLKVINNNMEEDREQRKKHLSYRR